jgi:hypothetical protein
MLMDLDEIELTPEDIETLNKQGYDSEALQRIEETDKRFFGRCPVCKTVRVIYRYETHSGGAGA